MKKIVLILNPAKVELLGELGFSPCGERDIGNGKTASQFVMTDKLFKVLNDRSRFTKRDYLEDTRLTF